MNIIEFLKSGEKMFQDDTCFYVRESFEGKTVILEHKIEGFSSFFQGFITKSTFVLGNTLYRVGTFSGEEKRAAGKEGFVLLTDMELMEQVKRFFKENFFENENLLEKEGPVDLQGEKILSEDVIFLEKLIGAPSIKEVAIEPREKALELLFPISPSNPSLQKMLLLFFYEGERTLFEEMGNRKKECFEIFEDEKVYKRIQLSIKKAALEGDPIFHVTDGKTWISFLRDLEEMKKSSCRKVTISFLKEGKKTSISVEKKHLYLEISNLFKRGIDVNYSLYQYFGVEGSATFRDIFEISYKKKDGEKVILRPPYEILKMEK